MAQKKETAKKDVKVQDLAPKKDAKGGRFSANSSANKGSLSADANIAANENRGSLSSTNYNAD